MRSFLPTAGAILAALVAVGCSSSSITGPDGRGSDQRVVKVVAAENFWGNIAGQIGGDHASVTSIITDPQYLTGPYATTNHFKKVPDNASGWDPTPCRADQPR